MTVASVRETGFAFSEFNLTLPVSQPATDDSNHDASLTWSRLAAGSSFSGVGPTGVLNLTMSFQTAFAGNQIVYMAARNDQFNTGWLALGTISVFP